MTSQTPRILIIGHLGKMGQAAVNAIESHPNLIYAGGCDAQQDLAQVIVQTRPTVGLDLTHPGVVFAHAQQLIAAGIHPVIGTSGLTRTQIETLKQQCDQKQLGGLIVPNFSIGAVLMMHFAAQAAAYLSDASIIETHHPQKKDAPSGTAIATAQAIQDARTCPPNGHASTEHLPGSLGANHADVAIHSVRLPGKVAHQTVMLGGPGETLSIQHDTLDRSAFMPGVCLACQHVVTLQKLIEGLGPVMLHNTAFTQATTSKA